MYINVIHIEDIRSIKYFHFELADNEKLAGWHVLIGDNGSGKSTILRSVALGLIGPRQALRLNPNWDEWLRDGVRSGKIDLIIYNSNYINIPNYKKLGILGDSIDSPIPIQLIFKRAKSGEVKLEEFGQILAGSTSKIDPDERRDLWLRIANEHIWGENKGWFSAAYGPFRRFSGNDSQMQSLMSNQDRVSAHASIFYEGIALSNYRDWLKDLGYTSLGGTTKEKAAARKLLENIKRFINQDGFLPYNTRFEAIVPSANGVQVLFVDGDGNKINVEQLGDGFRSILSMTFDLIRQMTIQYDDINLVFDDADPTIIKAPGVVLIDEVDAHLHPEWQRRIGFWLTEHFPNIQFIVTTHSPLVCQAASNGSIWRLPAPGSGETGAQVSRESEDWKRLVYGDILEAYSTDLFGENINRSPEAQEKMERVAALSGKELDAPLTTEETQELAQLMDELPSTPYKYTLGNGT